MRVRLQICLAVALPLIVACDKAREVNSPPKAKPAMVQTDVSTPDKAIKSYWAVRDSVRVGHEEVFRRSIGAYSDAESQMSSVTDGVLSKAFASNPPTSQTFGRDILDLKVESESRAIVIAVIKNTSPVPPGAELSKFDEERRRDGERYRYVLEKSGSNWRVSEIWEWETYPRPDWKKRLPGDGKPWVPSLTYDGM